MNIWRNQIIIKLTAELMAVFKPCSATRTSPQGTGTKQLYKPLVCEADKKKVMWSDESRLTLLPTVQACGGSVMIRGWFSWSGPSSATLRGQMTWIYWTIPRWQDQDSSATTESRPSPHWESLGEDFPQQSNSPTITMSLVQNECSSGQK